VHFKSLRWLLALAALLATWAAQASVIYTTSYALTNADPSQLGRVSRSGIPSDWSDSKAFPGTINAGTSYHYQTFTLDLDGLMAGFTFGQYLQISADFGTDTRDFVTSYLDSYDPTNLATNYLGDIGASGNSFGNPGFFQIVVGSGHDLVLVLSDTVAGGVSVPMTINLTVEAFTDTMFTDLTPDATGGTVPEPAALALVAVALAAMARARRRAGQAA